ncbi:MAG: hypothetical protein DYG87_05055 [Anaerolineae bacterium CFX3]|nr:hypothetical protein [Anaerolineae bacterium CFX3]MCQ3946460.1 hypothetical protein [Anaerolineae bacterium]RIK27440.1 MAG: hypothetical protein DCC54_03405 [Anaerolineae bacterium]
MVAARKVSFREAWDSSTVFYVDEELENEIDQEVEKLLLLADHEVVSGTSAVNAQALASFLAKDPLALDVILREIELSQEKFMRIVSLLRKLGHISGGFESEWHFSKIANKVVQDSDFALLIAGLLVDGKRDKELTTYIPRYYLETLNYREIRGGSREARRVRYKRSLIGTYSGRKGYKVEGLIRQKLMDINVPFEQGRSRVIETDIDFAVPGLDDPWIIIMSSFQETTSSSQTTKTRDMLNAFERVNRVNSRYGENRAFVNFVDGGGWLARKRDMERLVENCHYYVNINLLGLLESVVQNHLPRKKR